MGFTHLGDEFAFHPVVMRMKSTRDDRLLNEAVGWVTRCTTEAAGYETDFFISEDIAERCSPTRWKVLVKVAKDAKVFGPRQQNAEGDWGWIVNSGEKDELWHMLLKDENRIRKEHKNATRRDAPKVLARQRDGDQCRYCRMPVTFKNRRKSTMSARYTALVGAELDHVDPHSNELLVVACWPCNAKKAQRTPDEADMVLLPPPDPPWYRAETIKWLAEYGVFVTNPASGEHGSNTDRAEVESQESVSGSPELAPQGRGGVGVAGRAGPGREGPGSAGSVIDLSSQKDSSEQGSRRHLAPVDNNPRESA